MPNSVTYLNWMPMLEWYVVEGGFKYIYIRHMLKRDWTMCSNYDNYHRLNNKQYWEGGWGGACMAI